MKYNNQWISVKEKFPDCETVLVCAKDQDMCFDMVAGFACRRSDKWEGLDKSGKIHAIYSDYGCYVMEIKPEFITHWKYIVYPDSYYED